MEQIEFSPLFIVGLVVTLCAIVGLSIWTGKKNKGGKGRNNSLPIVTGLIMGTLVGGSSTVGTAQLAFTYGMSAWWFTLGGGIGCLILALAYAKPFRHAQSPTIVGTIRNEYGNGAGMAASILNSVGTFINIPSQLLAASAVIAVVFPNLGIVITVAVSAIFMILYVIFGGTKGAGIVGILKTLLLYLSIVACGIMVLVAVGGFGGFTGMVKAIENPEGVNFFSVFARGVGQDLGSALSLIFGVLTTQTYAQAVINGKSDRAAKGGALLSAFLIPPIGVGGILVGLYMRANAALYPGLTAKTALTTFVINHMPDLLAGIVLATLFIASVGTGAGLALGISTVINNDIVKVVSKKEIEEKKFNILSKVWIIAVLVLACFLSTGALGDVILNFAFMSMGLRAAVVFCPLCAALFLPGKVNKKWVFAAIIVGPLIVLLGNLFKEPLGITFDPLLIGIVAAAIVVLIGFFVKKKELNKIS